MAEAAGEAVGEALDRLRLVAGGLERGDQLEVGHRLQSTRRAAVEQHGRSIADARPRAPIRAVRRRVTCWVERRQDEGAHRVTPAARRDARRGADTGPPCAHEARPGRGRSHARNVGRPDRRRSPTAAIPVATRPEPGRVRPRADAALAADPGRHPVRAHLQLVRDDDERRARGRPDRDDLRLRPDAARRPRTTRPATTRSGPRCWRR